MINLKRSFAVAACAATWVVLSGCSTPSWQSRVDTVLPEYGHRNWIVIADAAYPKQSAPGIETIAPGVAEYRARLKDVLKDRPVQVKPHEQIIAKLDADSEVFNVLLLKTDLVIPYTSVFLQLDCGYWNAEKEARLRDLISRQK